MRQDARAREGEENSRARHTFASVPGPFHVLPRLEGRPQNRSVMASIVSGPPAASGPVVTKAMEERAKLESERRAAVQRCKDEKAAREAGFLQEQQQRSASARRYASTLRASQSAGWLAKRAEVHGRRREAAEGVKDERDRLRAQRDELRAQWRAHGREMCEAANESRHAASDARSELRERNLSEAHRATAELLDMFRHGAESQSAFNDAKRLMAERVRKEAGHSAVRAARSKAAADRANSASRAREKAERVAAKADARKQQQLEAHRAAAYRIELEASAERVRQLKEAEAERKASLTGALRRQKLALEALSLERKSSDAAYRQRMHDSVMCARYGVPSSPLHSIHDTIKSESSAARPKSARA